MTADLDGTLLRSFLEAARRGSIGRAAEALGQTQPALSQKIRRLEDVLGCPLMVRSRKGVTLTADGEAFRPYAERILALGAEAVDHIAVRRSKSRALRRIGILEDLAIATGIDAAIADAVGAFDDLEVTIVADANDTIVKEFGANRLDLMVGAPAADLPDIRAQRRRSLGLIWTASPSFDTSVRPLPLALCRTPSTWRDNITEVLYAAGIAWYPAAESGSLLAIQSAAASGAAIAAVLPSTTLTGLKPVDWRKARLPAPPQVDIALYRAAYAHGSEIDRLESLVWERLCAL